MNPDNCISADFNSLLGGKEDKVKRLASPHSLNFKTVFRKLVIFPSSGAGSACYLLVVTETD